jgi:hypothetical protein
MYLIIGYTYKKHTHEHVYYHAANIEPNTFN